MDELKKLEADIAGMCAELAALEEENETQRKKLRDLEIKTKIETFRLNALENLMKTSEDPFGDEFERLRMQWERLNEDIIGPNGLAFSCHVLKGVCSDCDRRIQELERRIDEANRIKEHGR